jgi:hypothetical protein
MINGEPKRPKNIVLFQQKQQQEESDFLMLVSMLFGIVSFIMKVKWGIWLSLIFFISSWVNTKYNSEQKNVFMNFRYSQYNI